MRPDCLLVRRAEDAALGHDRRDQVGGRDVERAIRSGDSCRRDALTGNAHDLVARARDGYIYFTDPDYGRWNDWIGCERVPLLGFKPVFRVAHEGGEAELVCDRDEFEQPNGLCFSPDESLLYVNDSPRAHIKVFEVAGDGTLVNGRVLAEGIGGTIEGGSPDGMECDEHGNIWTSGPGGVWVLDPQGERIGAIRTPEICGSVVFGGPDLRTLFLTTTTTVHSLPTKVSSAPLP